MLTAILKAVKMLLSCCPKNSQDAAVLAALKVVQDAEINHPTKTKYRDLFPSNWKTKKLVLKYFLVSTSIMAVFIEFCHTYFDNMLILDENQG
jgi:hypothetical protein